MNRDNLESLRTEYQNLLAENKKLSESWVTEDRNGTDEEFLRYDETEQEALTLKARIETIERGERLKNLQGSKRSEVFGAPLVKMQRAATKADHSNALRAWLAKPASQDINIGRWDSWRRSCDVVSCNWEADTFLCRDQSSDTATEGQEAVNGGTIQGIVEAMANYGGILPYCDVYNTSKGEPLPFIINDGDLTSYGAYSSQNEVVPNTALTFDTESLSVKDAKTGVYPIALQLIEDASFDISSYVSRKIGERLARTLERDMFLGNGTTAPQGLYTATIATGETGYSNNLTPLDLNNLYRSVNPRYRASPKCAWVMNDATEGHIDYSMKDSTGQPLEGFLGLSSDGVTQLKKKPVVLAEFAHTMVSGQTKKPIIFGDFSYVKVRFVGPPRIKRDDSRFFDQLAVGILGWSRWDMKYINPGNDPLKLMVTGTLSGD
jgi:HK97 family phage major capsid protein